MKTIIPILLLIIVLSCKESVATDNTTDTSWHNMYRSKFENVNFESLEDTFVKSALEKYYVADNERGYPVYDIIPENEIAKQNVAEYGIDFHTIPFDSSVHKLTTETGFVYLIDGEAFWGSDGTVPHQEISKFTVTHKNKSLYLPDSSYKDLFNPAGGPQAIYVSNGNDDYFIPILQGSDGAGAYTAAWIFKNGKYVRRVVDSVQ